MPYNAFSDPSNFLVVGTLTTTQDNSSNAFGDAVIGGCVGGGVTPTATAAATALASSGTVTTQHVRVARIAPTAAVTACVMQTGTIDGQDITVINEAASTFSVTFAASASSNIADGATTVIAPLRSARYTWDKTTALWYRA